MNFRKSFPFDPHFNLINELKQKSPFGNVLAFAHIDKELHRDELLVTYGKSYSGVMINCIKNYQCLYTKQNQFFSLVLVHCTKKKNKMKKK